MSLLALIIIGAAAGFIATRMMKLDSNVVTTVSIGVFGALFGGIVLRVLLTMVGWMAGFVGAVLGSMLLIWLWRTYWPRD
ncbi:MAG: GlsB/YeaQ/YmgE family stress response membrane protein [Paracoccaceae bacterium]